MTRLHVQQAFVKIVEGNPMRHHGRALPGPLATLCTTQPDAARWEGPGSVTLEEAGMITSEPWTQMLGSPVGLSSNLTNSGGEVGTP